MFHVRTSQGEYVLKNYTSPIYETPETLIREIKVLEYLDEYAPGFNIPLGMNTTTGMRYTLIDSTLWTLVPYISGYPLDMANPAHIRQLGCIYGEMHGVLQDYLVKSYPVNSPFIRFFHYASDHIDLLNLKPSDLGLLAQTSDLHKLCDLWSVEAQKLASFVETTYHELPKLLVHNDITPANILANQESITLLDFEFMAFSARAFDLATGLRHVMRIWQDPEPWQQVTTFFSAYKPYQSLTEQEILAMPDLLKLRAAIAIIWWSAQPGHWGRKLLRFY